MERKRCASKKARMKSLEFVARFPKLVQAAMAFLVMTTMAVPNQATAGNGTEPICVGPLVYISNTGSDDVWVVDIASESVVAVVEVGDDPRGIDITPDNSRVYVANRFDNSVSAIDTTSNTLAQTINLSSSELVTAIEPYDLAVSPDGEWLYVAMKNGGAENGDGTVVIVDLPGGAIVTEVILDRLASPEGIVVTPDGRKVYVAARGAMYAVDVTDPTNPMFLGAFGSAGRELVVSPAGAFVYADDNAVRTADDSAIVTGDSSGERGIAISPDGRFLYSTNENRSVRVVEITMEGGNPVSTFVTNIEDASITQSGSYGVDLNDAGDLGVVSFRFSDAVRFFDPTTNTFIGLPIPMEFTTGEGVVTGSEPKQLVISHGFDCNGNGIFDQCDIADSASPDENDNGIPDECEDLPTATPTPTTPAELCQDAGYYILDAFGGRHHVGIPVEIFGSLFYGRDVAVDMERTLSEASGNTGPKAEELAVLDQFGAVQFVLFPGDAPGQTFYWPEESDPACGNAVDFEMADDDSGFWVLSENGGIFRAGSALPVGEDAQLGSDAADLCNTLGIPFGGEVPRDPGLPTNDGASITAEGFAVVQSGDASAPTGFVVLDSQGGHYIFDGSGNASTDATANSILNPSTVYPFFQGLEIARDIELPVDFDKGATNDPTHGLVIYDGWGGVHPVPVTPTANSRVAFLRNDGLTTVGLPYLQVGFNDPSTPEDESNPAEVGIDVASIFTDIEFCSTGADGVYVLDGFGGVFAFGATRGAPDDVAPIFPAGGPYFFPNRYARDLEATGNFGDIGR
jgi:YVTN family beta-propeller protein